MTEALLASKILLDPTFDIMTPLDVTMNSSVIQVAKNANFSIFFEYFQIMKSVKSYIKDVRPAPLGGVYKNLDIIGRGGGGKRDSDVQKKMK